MNGAYVLIIYHVHACHGWTISESDADFYSFFAYCTLPCNALMVHAHTVVSISLPILKIEQEHSYSSRMRVIYHNWSATKQRPHPQSVAEISHHSVLSGDWIRQCETRTLTCNDIISHVQMYRRIIA